MQIAECIIVFCVTFSVIYGKIRIIFSIHKLQMKYNVSSNSRTTLIRFIFAHNEQVTVNDAKHL